ncbi:L-aspartate oxidase [Pseudarthrobacter sp. P1]|uniref:L-aspartate oxidase n=1 Tax=Pseudarthrobacter sp. P1 TaxID=3418418 RepID=UPI003CF166E5
MTGTTGAAGRPAAGRGVPDGGAEPLVVVGSGIAGLYSALLAAEAGVPVVLLTKGVLAASNTHLAQGGICAVLAPGDAAPGDTVAAHIADTLAAGAGQCDAEAVRILCTEACGDIAALERFSVAFDRDPATGERALGLEGAHSAARILHAGGDATGAAIADALIAAVHSAAAAGRITVHEHAFATELCTTAARTTGVRYLQHGALHRLDAGAVLLATGGAGQLFEFTTNPAVATADGLALAWRAGAAVADLEYFQFHPTALAVGGNFLISEAVRGAGAVLRDAADHRFMPDHHPLADLAPRDVVSRAIAAHLRSTGAAPGATVFLDATGVEAENGEGYLARRFPTIDAQTRALGFDWCREWLPVVPAAHYWMGGVATDLHGRTSIPGLYAAGEVACTGVHGANRLASNSLLEGLVFGRRAVAAYLAECGTAAGGFHGGGFDGSDGGAGDGGAGLGWPVAFAAAPLDGAALEGAALDGAAPAGPAPAGSAPLDRAGLRRLMSAEAGVVRSGAGLARATDRLAGSTAPVQDPAGATVAERELANLHLAAALLVQAAAARENSIGAHVRVDFPSAPAAGGRRSQYFAAATDEIGRPLVGASTHSSTESESA